LTNGQNNSAGQATVEKKTNHCLPYCRNKSSSPAGSWFIYQGVAITLRQVSRGYRTRPGTNIAAGHAWPGSPGGAAASAGSSGSQKHLGGAGRTPRGQRHSHWPGGRRSGNWSSRRGTGIEEIIESSAGNLQKYLFSSLMFLNS